MRLLHRARPDIDGAVMKETALVAERPVVMGPAFDDEVERFPMALVHAYGVAVGGQHLVRHAAHEARLKPPVREHVDHRHLLGDAHRLAAIGDGIAEDEKPRLAGESRQCRQHERRRRIDAGGGLMMLVEHDLDALVLGDQPFVDEPVIERSALDRVVHPIGQRHAYGRIGFSGRQVGIGVFAEMPGSHVSLPGTRAPQRQRPRAAPDAARGRRPGWSAPSRRATDAHKHSGNPRRRGRRSRRG